MEKNTYNPITVDIKGLQSITGLGKNNAMQIGKDADAVVRLGVRRTLYNVQKIQEYINNHTGTSNNDK